jgi:(1->4)-alpha-D-glucan 1-alpha-D-glucosylmutase
MADAVATYRWQLVPGAGFADAAAAVPDLAALGISHLYLSPIAEAVPGSTHGYDVTDPTRVRAELGGAEGFAALLEVCRAHGMGVVVDIVPNHLAAHEANPWWWDVLRLGRASRHADLFDIDWGPSGVLLLPVLGDHYGRELEAGALRMERGDGPTRLLVVRYHERTFPVRPEATGAILAAAARAAGDDVLGVAARLLARAESTARHDERDADLTVAEGTARARLQHADAQAAVDAELARLQADPDALDLVLGRQHYRLARWVVGDAELDYRRFFDVDALVATRMAEPATFDRVHALIPDLLGTGVVDGVRVDHIDGLWDPSAYLVRLRDLVGPDTWLLVEKIVRRDEELPAWPVDGTTGYEVADLLGAWLTDPDGAASLHETWSSWTGEGRPYEEVALEARREVLTTGFAADLGRVVDALQHVCEQRRRHRDHTRAALRAAVVELVVHVPRYRTYVGAGADAAAVSAEDHDVIATAVADAKAGAPALDPELFDLLAALLVRRLEGEAEETFALRFQQLTGPVAAKGEEDTALYRWLPLPHRCEVGSDPSVPTASAAEWHAACERAHARWPRRLTTISTHDTKRSADARARLAALTAEPDRTRRALERWWTALGDARAGIPRDVGWLLFHTLVAGWPSDRDRAWTIVRKSVREAGVHTSWVRPDEAFEAALHDLVGTATSDPAVRAILLELVQGTAEVADRASLAQLLAQLLAPGVPDVYRGGEGWDHSLVDPDNRRPVDPTIRSALIRASATTSLADTWADPERRRSGLPRTVVLRTALAARARHPAAVGPGPEGAYAAMAVTGPDAGRVLAFTRGEPASLLVCVARPGSPALDAGIDLREDWTDLFTGARHRGSVPVADLVGAGVPVALLER